jgi:hypothetical protein
MALLVQRRAPESPRCAIRCGRCSRRDPRRLRSRRCGSDAIVISNLIAHTTGAQRYR